MSSRRTRDRLDAALADLFGAPIDWRNETGLLQVTAIAAATRSVLAVGAGAPASPTDRFVLGFARARADAIVTTGAILRAEPDLVHRFSDDPEEDAAWRDWRADRLGRSGAPVLLVLSLGGEIPLAHPALARSVRTIVWTSPAGQERLRRAGSPLETRVGPDGPLSIGSADAHRPPPAAAVAALSDAYRWLRAEIGARTVSIEAGPRATLGLYASGGGASAIVQASDGSAQGFARVDELLLSVFEGGAAPAVAGPAFPDSARLSDHFATAAGPRSRLRVEERSGAWVFERYRRTPGR